jgi:hypothetical protein
MTPSESPIVAERVTCNCEYCAEHAARYGKTLPLAVEVPARFTANLTRLKSGAFPKSLRHTLVHQGHEQSSLSLALRTRSGITPVEG